MAGRFGRPSPSVVKYAPVAVVGSIWLVAKLLRFAFPALFPVLQGRLVVPNAWLGIAYAAMMLLYSAMQFPSGALADSLDDVRVIVVGAVLAAGGALVLLLPPSFPVLVAGMLCIGLGTGVHKTVSVTLLSRVYTESTGWALGVFDTLGTLGGVIAPGAVVLAVTLGDWRLLFVVAAISGIVATVALLSVVPRQQHVEEDVATAVRELSFRPYFGPFQERRFKLFVAITLCAAFAYNGVLAFLPLYLVDLGISETTASAIYTTVFVASVVQLVTGDLSDRFGRLTVSASVLLLAASALTAMVLLSTTGPLMLGVFAFAFGLGSHGFRPIRGAYLSTEFPEATAGGGLGLVRTMLMGVGAVAPALVGFVADVVSFRFGFAILAAAMALAALLAIAAVGLKRVSHDSGTGPSERTEG